MNSQITTAAPWRKEQEPKTRHIKNSNSPALFAVFLQIDGGKLFCPGVFSRFILASLCSFVKARSGGPWQITGKLRARWGSQRGQGRTPSGALPRQVKQGAAVFLVILNTPRPSSLAIATPCFSALVLPRAKINTPCRCTPSGSSPAVGVFRASFGLRFLFWPSSGTRSRRRSADEARGSPFFMGGNGKRAPGFLRLPCERRSRRRP